MNYIDIRTKAILVCFVLMVLSSIYVIVSEANKVLAEEQTERIIIPDQLIAEEIRIEQNNRISIMAEEILEVQKEEEQEEQKLSKNDLEVPSAGSSFKSCMDYNTITRKSSKQYSLKQLCYTDEEGLRRFNGYYAVAMGTGFIEYIGQTFIVTLSSGKTFSVIAGDVKADFDTDSTNKYCLTNGSVVEFIIDKEVISKKVLAGGDISKLGFEGKVIKIEKEGLHND